MREGGGGTIVGKGVFANKKRKSHAARYIPAWLFCAPIADSGDRIVLLTCGH
jgi:hypothetical protein